ncbi:MAG: 4Fe-4S dicluster domain-containing protein [Epsilonproteobacteria bacterium]|nr:4Fe-4S dicluster domain-containing protein [Campylobacterota bacterium]
MKERQLAMVIDLNKCIGCQNCTVTCKTMWTNSSGKDYMYWNNVETIPGNGYPKNWQDMGGGFDADGSLKNGKIPNMSKEYGIPWEYNHDEIMSAKEFKPKTEPTWGVNWDEEKGGGEFPKDNYFFNLPRICNHCSKPSCLSACPHDAIFKRQKDGIVLVDMDLCQGCRYCIAACPYKKIYFNPQFSKSEKCNFCFPLIEEGLPPLCASDCSGRARFVGYLDDIEGQVYKLIKKYKVALPLRPDFGVEPNVYYIPPFLSPPKFDKEGNIIENSDRIRTSELVKLFGEEIYDAIKTLKNEKRDGNSELLKMLVASQDKDRFRFKNKDEANINAL